MKKFILNIIILIINIVMIAEIISFFSGSIEMYPTIEQLEQVRITSLIVIIICLVTDVVLFKIKRKISLYLENNYEE